MEPLRNKDVTEADAHRRSSSEDLEDLPLTDEEHRFTPQPRYRRWRSCRWPETTSPFWRLYSFLMTAFALIFLLTAIHESTNRTKKCSRRPSYRMSSPHRSHPDSLDGYPQPAASWKERNTVETRFFRDLRYMTLDHESDYLWKEHLYMKTGNIRLPPPDGKGNATLKSIAM